MQNQASDKPLDSNGYMLLAGRSNPILAQKIADILGKELCEPISSFADGEIRVKGIPNLRRRQVFVIQPTSSPVNDHIMELLLMIDAAKRASANEIIAVMPYFGYSRQDRKEMPRVPISASVVAKMIEQAGANRILTLDIHSEQAEGFVQIPWDNLYGSYALLPAINDQKLKNLVVASPDKGGMVRTTAYARRLEAIGIASVYKERDLNLNNVSSAMGMIGDVKDKDVLLVDDLVDTAGTLVNAANYLKKHGAKRIVAAATHGIFSGNAIAKITDSAIEKVIVTDSVHMQDEVVSNPKIHIVSVAPLLAAAVSRVRTGESLSKDLIL
ncbi:MAG: ribose-phosphate diphosphokinase [Patescibacteria group bacterium]|nr:ribose-phosphate diphosphokinase [Patescibacteria group bacterium]